MLEIRALISMIYIRRIFKQDLRDGKQIAFPKEPSYSFFSFPYADKPTPADRNITFCFKSDDDNNGKEIKTRLYSDEGESRIDSELKRFLIDSLKVQIGDLIVFESRSQKNGLYSQDYYYFSLIKKSSQDYSSYLLLCDYSGVKDNHRLFLTDFDSSSFSGNVQYPIQTIIYGSPGTGKSHEVSERYLSNVSDEFIIRTTFHPGSDYSSFVGCYKPTMEINANGQEDIKYKFIPQAFINAYVKAWNNLSTPIYLVIEEINRGNCAQIFGDIFQLLDRDKNGFSKYPITADDDIRKYLERQLVSPQSLNGILNGKMALPRNLNLIATMNTSDQSLFPMDSAFKRRWEWEPKPIDYSNNESSNYVIEISNSVYSWHEFLKTVNSKIFELTRSEDKQLGNFFIKLFDSNSISQKTFINKVMFYIWSDICKEEIGSPNYFLKTKNKQGDFVDFTFNSLFSSDVLDILKGFMEYLEITDISQNESIV